MPKCCERWARCWMFSVPWLWKLNTNLGTSCGQTVLSRSDVACLFPEETCQVWCEVSVCGGVDFFLCPSKSISKKWLSPSGPKSPASRTKGKIKPSQSGVSSCRALTDPAGGSTLVSYRPLSAHGPSREQKSRPALTPPCPFLRTPQTGRARQTQEVLVGQWGE